MDESLAQEISDLLGSFSGEDSIKELFWGLLSFDREQKPLNAPRLIPSVASCIGSLQIFASRGGIKVLVASVHKELDRYGIERICRQLKKYIPLFVLLLKGKSQYSWAVIYPDETKKEFLRILPLPGPNENRLATAAALASLAANEDESFGWLETAEQLEIFFPGGMPRSNPEFGDLEAYLDRARPQIKHMAGYVKEMVRFPFLTSRQEWGEDLRPEYSPPDGSAMNYQQWRLIVHNLRLVIYWACRMPCEGMEIDDLIQEGNIGLMIAARKFDPSRRNRFTTYASYWICQRMFRALEENWSLFHWPSYKAFPLIRANITGEIDQLGLGERRERRLELDDYGKEFMEDPREGQEELIELSEMRQIVRKTVDSLSVRDQNVIKLRFGVGTGEEMTLEQIGEQHGLTREYIRQIQMQAIETLKRRLPLEISEGFKKVKGHLTKRRGPKRYLTRRYYAHA
jgi:RNA polymerase primary sigma factor